MSSHFADRLLAACAAKGAPVCVGIDPVAQRLPITADDPVDAIERWTHELLDAVTEHVPVVKFQSACYERHGGSGVTALHRLIAAAKDRGLITIFDAKRGDIGISAAHYAAANPADALTVSPYLGDDSLTPFIEVASSEGTGLFVLVRTSNPGSDALQQRQLAEGGNVAQAVARMVADLGDTHRGECGYSLLGAVVGATKPAAAATLRQLMPHQIFLVPGYGAQGGTAADVKACFNADGAGALITASRSVIFAHEQRDDVPWQQAVAEAAASFSHEIAAIV